MAYQNSYGARPGPVPHMYNAGAANAPHFPPPAHQQLPHQQHQHQLQLQHQHPQQHFYPSPYPHSAAPSPSYLQPQVFHAAAHTASRQPYLSNQSQGNGGPPLMPPPSNVPDDPFKKPHLPQHRISEPQSQYMQNAQSPPFHPRYNQQQSTPSASTLSNIAATAPGEAIRSPASSLELPASSMTAPAISTASTGQLTTPPESPLHAQGPSAQASNISPQEQERVDALLSVNNLLLQEVQILQKAGLKAPPTATLSSPQAKAEGTTTTPTSTDPADVTNQTTSTSTTPTATTPATATPTALSSNNPIQNQKKFVEYMGRLKTNIYYLVAINDQSKQKTKPPYPTHLEPPPGWIVDGLKDEDKERFEALKEGYAKLRELWPDWKPQPRQQAPQAQQQHQQSQLQQALQEQRQQMQPQLLQQQQQQPQQHSI